MDAPGGCTLWFSGVEATVDAPQLPTDHRSDCLHLCDTGSWCYYWGYGREMTIEDSIAEPLPRLRTSPSAYPIHPFTAPEAWPTTTSDHAFDVVQLAQQIYCGGLAKETHMPLPRSRRWPVDIFLGRGLERRR